jgi:hypothetical protein
MGVRFVYVCPQQPLADVVSGPQAASFPLVKAARIMAAAHPTPLSTVMAPAGQLSWQAPHSMQAAWRMSRAARRPGANTPCGQTMLHIPQLVHRSGS